MTKVECLEKFEYVEADIVVGEFRVECSEVSIIYVLEYERWRFTLMRGVSRQYEYSTRIPEDLGQCPTGQSHWVLLPSFAVF